MAGTNEKPSEKSWTLQREAAMALACLSNNRSQDSHNTSSLLESDETQMYIQNRGDSVKGVNSLVCQSNQNDVGNDIRMVIRAHPGTNTVGKGGKAEFAKTFPQKLHEILDSEGYSDTITWLPHGKSFAILDRQKLVSEVLPKHSFKQCKFGSFTRKLYLWGFRKISQGQDAGSFYHERFWRGDLVSCLHMKCSRTPRDIHESHCSDTDSCKKVPAHRAASIGTTDHSSQSSGTDTSGSASGRRSSLEDANDDEEDEEDFADDNDEDYFDRKEAGYLPQINAVDEDTSTRISHIPFASGVAAVSDIRPQFLSGNLTINDLALQSLLGVTESPIMQLYNSTVHNITDIDRDTLTEMLLHHHQKKLFLRTALLSDMVRALDERKAGQQASASGASTDDDQHDASGARR